jgi:hypothetical protein
VSFKDHLSCMAQVNHAASGTACWRQLLHLKNAAHDILRLQCSSSSSSSSSSSINSTSMSSYTTPTQRVAAPAQHIAHHVVQLSQQYRPGQTVQYICPRQRRIGGTSCGYSAQS